VRRHDLPACTKEGVVIKHDFLCERDTTLSTYLGSGCKCASRAYQRDPLPDDVTPIWTPIWARNTEDQ